MIALKAELLIQRIHDGCNDYDSWLQLEKEVQEFFSELTGNELEMVDQMFVDDGAGELLYMICSGIRKIKERVCVL